MKENIGSADKIIRVLLALLFAALYFSSTVSGTLGLVLLVLAGIFLLTTLIGTCPLYVLFGINTCKKK